MRHIHPHLQHCDANCRCCRPLDEEPKPAPWEEPTGLSNTQDEFENWHMLGNEER